MESVKPVSPLTTAADSKESGDGGVIVGADILKDGLLATSNVTSSPVVPAKEARLICKALTVFYELLCSKAG